MRYWPACELRKRWSNLIQASRVLMNRGPNPPRTASSRHNQPPTGGSGVQPSPVDHTNRRRNRPPGNFGESVWPEEVEREKFRHAVNFPRRHRRCPLLLARRMRTELPTVLAAIESTSNSDSNETQHTHPRAAVRSRHAGSGSGRLLPPVGFRRDLALPEPRPTAAFEAFPMAAIARGKHILCRSSLGIDGE